MNGPATKDLTPEDVARLIETSGAFVAGELRALGADASFHPAPAEWCANEVAGHIIEAERRGFAGRIRRFLESDGPDELGWDQVAVERERQDCRRDPGELADELEALRKESVVLLRSLRPEHLSRWGTHSKVGRLTVHDRIHDWEHHERNHARQRIAVTPQRV